jgi:2-oxoisovalerate dehydrogenase E1 component
MATKTTSTKEKLNLKEKYGFSNSQLVDIYRKMVTARRLDEKMLLLLKQSKSFFHIGGSGHEAAHLGSALAFKPAYDWAYPYYRDLAFVLGWGETAEEIMLCFLSKKDDPNSGGRQMPSHYGHKPLRIVSQSSPTGTQYLQAVGCAMGCKKDKTDEVVYVSSGEGTTSQGDFHEALNWASRDKLPVIFFIQDNKYAISVPISQQTAGGSIYKLASGYEGLERFEVDGTDFFKTYEATKKAIDRARRGEGPSLILADVVRLLPHSSSDDQRKYRSEDELAKDKERDPIPKFVNFLISEKILTLEEVETINEEVVRKVDEATAWADNEPYPDKSTAELYVYSPNPPALEYEKTVPNGKPIVLVDAINHALDEEMSRNPKMLIYGEDIQDPKGGVFTATKGLTNKHNVDRVFNSPLAESSIVGTAIGLAVKGFKPVVEIQFGDYIWTAMMQIRDELATMRYRSDNNWSCPVVIRVPVGGYIHGALYHSQNIEGFFAHLPGIYVAYPSNASDAKGLLKTACRLDDPVLFLEHKGLYRQGFATSPEPDDEYLLPFGKARIVKEGTDLTIVTWGMMVNKSVEASKIIEKQGINVEIIDIRTINPLDSETIFNSVKKTNKVLIVHEDTKFHGFGAEISAQISDLCFEYLDGPIRRVAGKDTPIPYNWFLEEVILPQTEDVVKGIEELTKY